MTSGSVLALANLHQTLIDHYELKADNETDHETMEDTCSRHDHIRLDGTDLVPR